MSDSNEEWHGRYAERIGRLKAYCLSGSISLIGLQEMMAGIPSSCLQASSFFHVCRYGPGLDIERRLKPDTVRFILKAFPGAAHCAYRFKNDANVTYPIHFACQNPHFPSSAMKLLVEKNQAALSHPAGYCYSMPYWSNNLREIPDLYHHVNMKI